MSGYRPEYTEDEESKIVNFIVEKRYIHRIKGDQIWKEMAEEKIIDRTWQSLKQHFRRVMIYQLHYPRYNLDKETVDWFRAVFNKEPNRGNKQKTKKTNSNRLQTNKENRGRNTQRQEKTSGGDVVSLSEESAEEGRPKYPDFFEDTSSSDSD